MPVGFLKNDRSNSNFLFKKYASLLVNGIGCVPVTIIIGKLYRNKLMLAVGTLVSCFLQPDVNLFLLERTALIKQ